jgi:hypothetical protein
MAAFLILVIQVRQVVFAFINFIFTGNAGVLWPKVKALSLQNLRCHIPIKRLIDRANQPQDKPNDIITAQRYVKYLCLGLKYATRVNAKQEDKKTSNLSMDTIVMHRELLLSFDNRLPKAVD